MLRFYNSTTKRDFNRFDSEEILQMPRQKFVPWFIKRTAATDDYVKTINLVNQAGSLTDISAYFETTNELLTGWTNGAGAEAYDTFTPSTKHLSSVIQSGDSENHIGYSNTLDFTLVVGDVFYMTANLTLNSGVAPEVFIGDATTKAAISNSFTLAAGINYISFKITTLGSGQLIISSDAGDDTSYGVIFGTLKGSVRPHPIVKTDDYLPYFGGSLSTLLPLGVYSLKVSDELSDYYSDWFCVSDIQPTLISSLTNSGFNTLTYTAATHAIVAVESDSAASTAKSNTFAVVPGEEIYFSGCLKVTSGVTPTIGLYDNADDSVISAAQALDDGDNLLTFTSDRTATAYMKLAVTNNASFTISLAQVYRAYGDYVRIVWENTKDVRDTASKADLLFSSGLTQEIFLDTYLNTPIHESNEIGQEKDGTFIAEKMTATPRQRIVAYVPRSTYEGLIPMPLCDTITVWDEVGNKYLVGGAADQATGNLEVNFDFTNFEIGTLEILFSESSYYWTENIDNVS